MAENGDEPVEPARSRSERAAPLLACALLALHASLLVWAACTNSVTFDEFAHVPAGAAYWRHGALQIYSLSPPLLRWLMAWPVVAAGAEVPDPDLLGDIPPARVHWAYGELFLRANAERYQDLFVLARLGMIPLSLLGGWIAYYWARQLYGPMAGVVACGLFALCPNVLAHGSIAGTDAGTSTVFLAAAWAWWRYGQARRALHLGLAALAVALAHLCKFSALLLWPFLVIAGAWFVYRADDRRRAALRIALALALCVAATWLVINLAYGFSGTLTPLGYYEASATMRGAGEVLGFETPVPLPRTYVSGFDIQKRDAEGGYPAYLFGTIYPDSRWYYYPVALGCKLPLATIALLLGVAGSFLWPRSRPSADEILILIALATFALGMEMLARVNIGVRYVLPLLPLLFVLAGRVTVWRWGRVVAAGAVGLAAIEMLFVAPNFLSFVNMAAGGPSRGWQAVNDSNYDWGQDLLRLRQWVDAHGVERLHLAYFGRADPLVYGIAYTPLTELGDEPFVAMSSYYLAGLPHQLPTPQGPSSFARLPPSFAVKMREVPPYDVVGRTIFIFRREDVDRAWRLADVSKEITVSGLMQVP